MTLKFLEKISIVNNILSKVENRTLATRAWEG
jgi:hypothetical protein